MNLETRTFVLEKALLVEKSVSDILQLFLNVEINKKKAFTNKSGGLSFKNKLDLLFDIEIFDDTEYLLLLLLMEYRNQFMHNYECNTFTDAFTFLGPDKKTRLLNYAKNKLRDTDEENIKDAFSKLNYEIIKILLAKIELKKSNLSENKEYFQKLNSKVILLYDKYFNLCEIIFDTLEPTYDDSKELVCYKMQAFKKLNAFIEQDINSKDFNQHDHDKSEEYKIKLIRRTLNMRK